MASTTTEKKKESEERTGATVKKALKLNQFKRFAPLEDSLCKAIATLSEDFMKDLLINDVLKLLSAKVRYAHNQEMVSNLENEADEIIPRSLAIKFKLTSPSADVMKTDEFKQIQGEAESTIKNWQRDMKNLILKVKRLDLGKAEKEFQNLLHKFMERIIFMKCLISFKRMQPGPTLTTWETNGGAKLLYQCVVMRLCDKNNPSEFSEAVYKLFWTELCEYSGYTYESIKSRLCDKNSITTEDAKTFMDDANKYKDEHKEKVKSILTWCAMLVSTLTYKLLSQYNQLVRESTAVSEVEAYFKSADTSNSTQTVDAAIAEEETVTKSQMKDYIAKVAKEEIRKEVAKAKNQTTSILRRPGKSTPNGKALRGEAFMKSVQISPESNTNDNSNTDSPRKKLFTSVQKRGRTQSNQSPPSTDPRKSKKRQNRTSTSPAPRTKRNVAGRGGAWRGRGRGRSNRSNR